MFGRLLTRCLQTSAGAPVEKAALLELRNKTGYTFSNCKKALQLSDNDVSKAERWLHQQAQEQGWAKASKVTGRARGQGLVAVHRDGPFAAMAEVNCETDFVARTEDFRTFVDKLVRACTSHAKKLPSLETGVTRVSLASAEVEKLRVRDGGAVGEARALLVGRLGEDVAVRRVLCLRSEAALLAGFCHGDQAPQTYPCFGKYGALVTYRALSECMLSEEELEQLGRGLCQQVVGMRPSSVGLLEDFLREQEEQAKRDAQLDKEAVYKSLEAYDYFELVAAPPAGSADCVCVQLMATQLRSMLKCYDAHAKRAPFCPRHPAPARSQRQHSSVTSSPRVGL